MMVRSPIDSASPGGDYPLADLTATTMEEATSGVSIFPSTGIDRSSGKHSETEISVHVISKRVFRENRSCKE